MLDLKRSQRLSESRSNDESVEDGRGFPPRAVEEVAKVWLDGVNVGGNSGTHDRNYRAAMNALQPVKRYVSRAVERGGGHAGDHALGSGRDEYQNTSCVREHTHGRDVSGTPLLGHTMDDERSIVGNGSWDWLLVYISKERSA